MDDEDDSVSARAGLRSPVRELVEGDTPNPNYTEVRPSPGPQEPLARAYGYKEAPEPPAWLSDLRRRLTQPLQTASEHLPPGAMDVLSAVLPGPKAAMRPSARPPLPDIPAPAIRAGRQTVTQPVRDPLFPGIYGNPKDIAAEAAARAVPESENLSRVFPRVSRETLADINQQGTRQGNVDPSTYLALAPNARGSESAPKVMNRANEQRILDIATEAGKYPRLRDMDNWYVMDPMYQRMVQLFGPDEAKQRFRFLQAMMGMASPGSEVTTEIPRGLVAHYLAHQGRFQDFINFGGKTSRMEDATGIAMPGHPYHSTSQAGPMSRFLNTGDMLSSMKSPKVPNYIYAHGVPETGFQTKNAVPDAHWSRLVGLGDARRGPSDIGASASMSEMQDLWPWWQRQIAQKLGIEPVPAQARVWGAGSGQTGVSSPIGPSKLEMFSDHVAKTAHRLGVSPETARDMILTGTAYEQGGAVHKEEGGSASQEYRSPVRDVVEGDTVNPSYTEVRQSSDPREGPIQRALTFNEPLANRLPPGAMDILAGILGSRPLPNVSGYRPSAQPPARLPASTWAGENLAREIENTDLPDRPASLMDKLDRVPQAPRRDVLSQDMHFLAPQDQAYWYVGKPSATSSKHLDPYITARPAHSPSGDYLRIIESYLPDNLRGKGVGIAAYQRMIDEAHARGMNVRSDTALSPYSARIYPALRDRGYQVERSPVATDTYERGIEGHGRPVFTVKPPIPYDDPNYRRGGTVHRDSGGRASDVDPGALARSPGRQLDPNPQQIDPDPNRPEYTGQINDFKEHPYWNVINMLRQIPMSMGYTGAAEGAATMGALGHILSSILARGSRGPAGARFAPTTPASPSASPVPTNPDRGMISRALHGEKPLRVDLHGKIPGDVEVKDDGGRVRQFANPNMAPKNPDYDTARFFTDPDVGAKNSGDFGTFAAIGSKGYESTNPRLSDNFEDRTNENLPNDSKRDYWRSLPSHIMPDADETALRMLRGKKKK